MEDTNYIFDAKSYVMGARDRQGPVIKIEDEYLNDRVDGTTKKTTRTMKERGDNLLAGIGVFNNGAVKVVQNRNYAQEQTMKNNYYRFIMQVAGFANEPIQKLWNDNFKKDETPLLSEGLSIRPLDNSKFGVNVKDKKEDTEKENDLMFEDTIENQLQAKGNILRSAEVSGQLLLSPSAYSHLLEAWEIIRHRCNTNVSLDTLVSVEHSTYFARLVALRIQLSRFLSGRYYSVASNYKRLLFQQESLVRGYFKAKFNQGVRPAAHSYLRQIQEL